MVTTVAEATLKYLFSTDPMIEFILGAEKIPIPKIINPAIISNYNI